MDYKVNQRMNLFGRYDHAPSQDSTRYWEEEAVDEVNTDTATVGATLTFAATKVNEIRANWSRATGSEINNLTNFHGAVVPPTSVIFPPPFAPDIGQALVAFPDDGQEVRVGAFVINTQRQLNFVDTFSWALATHQLKLGIDYGRLSPTNGGSTGWLVDPNSYSSLIAGTADNAGAGSRDPFNVNISNYSLYAQDTWKAGPRLTLTYGLRWEINTPPSRSSGQSFYVTQGIFESLPLAVVPGKLWSTTFGNLAPRIGVAYRVTPKAIMRGGYGLFYDLGYGSIANGFIGFPYSRSSFVSQPGLPFNLSNPAFQLPPISTTITANTLGITAVDPHLQLPFTMQWNAAFEISLGAKQTLSATYVGADGRRLIRQDYIVPQEFLNSGSGGSITAIHNLGYSHYNAFQVQFQRQLSSGFQALVSYNLSKASDLGSEDDGGLVAPSISQIMPPPLTPGDFDTRNTLSGAISYEIPAPDWGSVGNSILKGWAVDGLLRVTSPPPINVTVESFSPDIGYYFTQAEIVAGQPYWLPAPTQPGGKVLNPSAFTPPATGMTGNFPRNGLRSPFSIDQTDLAVRRCFNLTERVRLDIRVEYFNIFNHPMFGAPGNTEPSTLWGFGGYPNPGFGQLSPGSTTNTSLGLGGIDGGQNPLYAVGGPRSGQLTLKITF